MKTWRLPPVTIESLLSFALLLVILASLALGLTSLVRALEPWLLLLMVVLGLSLGWAVSRSRLSVWAAGPLLLVLGVVIILGRVGRLGGLLWTLFTDLVRLVFAAARWYWDGPPDLMPLTATGGAIWTQLATLLSRLLVWLQGLAAATPTFDPVTTALVWSFAVWVVSVWASWLVRRHNQPLLAVLPAGALLALSLFSVEAKPWALVVMVGATLMLMAVRRHHIRQQRWQISGVKTSLEIEGERLLTATLLSLTLVAVAAVVPSISVDRIVEFVASLNDTPSEGRPVASSLGLRQRPEQQTAIDNARVPGLPRSVLLGSGPELSEEIVMIIHLEEHDPAPAIEVSAIDDVTEGDTVGQDPDKDPPRLYWRSLTYDRYTGRGWWTGQPRRDEKEAGAAIPEVQNGTQQRLVQQVQVITDVGRLVHTAGRMVQVDQDFAVAWRSRSDLGGLDSEAALNDLFGATIDAASYQVESRLSIASEQELRQAGNAYPDWIQRRYLALPDGVPPRVLGLARDLTATAPTPYDRAKAIEAHLRTYPYNLDLPAPPSDRDMVDYFLFDLRQGYCDYYASSMVVLARAAGIPARLVVGYIEGTYDEENRHYVVTAADAHSWVEVYFPDHGWIEFDPTARLSPIERPDAPDPDDLLAEAETALSLAEQQQAAAQSPPWGLWLSWLAVPFLGIMLWLGFDQWRLHRLPPAEALTTLYQRLYRQSDRFTGQPQASLTPYQFARLLIARLSQLFRSNRPQQLAALQDDIQRMIDLHVLAHFSPHRLDQTEQAQAIKAWRRIQRQLWLLRWRR